MGRRFLGQITSPLFATASISQPLPHSVPLFLLSQYETELAAAKAMHSTESARVEALKAEHMEHRQSLVDEHDAEVAAIKRDYSQKQDDALAEARAEYEVRGPLD